MKAKKRILQQIQGLFCCDSHCYCKATTMALTLSPSPTQSSSLFASIDMGTNSFNLLIVRADPSGRFIPIHRTKHRVLLGRDVTPTPYSISSHSTLRALEALSDFHNILQSHHVTHTRCVATAAIRDAGNTKDFVNSIPDNIGMKVDVLSGEEEARLGYLGVLQFLPVYDKLALTVDIGGGSTEFVVGFKGKSVFATSLKLGHVALTQRFPDKDAVPRMREHIRSVIHESGVVERIKEHGFEIAVGSSGTIRAIDEAVFRGVVDGGKRGWGFSRGELRGVVEMLCDGEGKKEKEKERVFKKRLEFMVAGAVLLEEIFEMLGIEEMKVSGYSLGEGVIAESLAKLYPSYYDLNANARWQSVMRLAMRFNGKKKMRSVVGCAGLAKDIFEGLRNYKDQARNKDELASLLIEKDLEYLEAASLLHNIGLVTGKKGYHKQSYHIIMNGGHLCDYNPEEVKLIALLTRHHRKKFPKSDSFMENHKEENQRFRCLCAIIRISVALLQHDALKSQESSDVKNQHLPTIIQHIVDNTVPELRQETHNFKTVFEL